MADLELEFPMMRYDITMPLLEGRVKIEGVKLKPVPAGHVMVFNDDPVLREGSFGLVDLNVGYLLPAIDAGWEITALPVFSKRKPCYQYVFVRSDVVKSPKDLEGKRIGTRSYPTGLTTWNQGLLEERYGVDHRKLHWRAAMPKFFPIHDNKTDIAFDLDPKKSMAQVLFDGDVDAIISDISDTKMLGELLSHPKVKRLWPNYIEDDEKLYRETGLFTPVHVMILSRKLHRAHPDLARKLYNAFEQAKELAYTDLLNERGGFSVVYLRERFEEQRERWGDPWKYGFKVNQGTIDTYAKYCLQQGLIRGPIPNDKVFAEGTLDT